MIEDLWYKNAVFYNLDLDSFLDADGDGHGDFEGLIRKLDYLEALGVDVLWLAPFQPTPNRDNGYDIRDYFGVDPSHGSAGDFVEFVHQAKKRGFKVLIDLVINHTSDQHPWFRSARIDPDSPFRSFYIWSEERPERWDQGMVFPGPQEATWTWDEEAGAWYFHRFFSFQPDLDMDNPAVRDQVRRIIGFWLQLGVDGFRVDAVPFVVESPPREDVPGELRFEYIEEFRTFAQWRRGDAVLLGEANVVPEDARRYFDHGRGLHMLFNFWVNQHLFYALATGDARPLAEALEATREVPVTCQWGHFLRNHDELDLGRLSDDQRRVVFDRFAPDPDMRIFGRGIRRRLAPMLGSRPRLELANSLLLALPGTPVLRYGDEIGMGDDLSLDGRAAVRTAMQWSPEPGGGFSMARHPRRPVIERGPFGAAHVNVQEQERDPSSFLSWTIRMLRLRKATPEIGWGRWQIVPAGVAGVLALLYEWRGSRVLVVHNLTDAPCEIELELPERPTADLADQLARDDVPSVGGRHRLTLAALGYRWFRVGHTPAALQLGPQEPVEQDDAGPSARRGWARERRVR